MGLIKEPERVDFCLKNKLQRGALPTKVGHRQTKVS